WRRKYCLLQLGGGAGSLEILLDLLGVFLRQAVLDVLRRALDQVLGLLQAQAGDGTDDLDDLDLLVADGLPDDGELGLLLGGGGTAGGRGSGDGDRGGGGDTELLLHRLDQLHHLDEGLAGDRVDDLLVAQGHCVLPRVNRFGNDLGYGNTGTELGLQAAFAWPAALMTRVTCDAGSLSRRTSCVAGWSMTLSSIDSASSRVGSEADRKSTRLNSSHVKISYAVFCLKKKKDRHT